jgi:hypothetical protein
MIESGYWHQTVLCVFLDNFESLRLNECHGLVPWIVTVAATVTGFQATLLTSAFFRGDAAKESRSEKGSCFLS